MLSGLGLHYILKNAQPDGTNINSQVGSEYYRKFPQEFAHEIIKSGAELGIAFDGDADRVIFVDCDGLLYDGDMLLAIIAFSLQEQKLLNVWCEIELSIKDIFACFRIEKQYVRTDTKFVWFLVSFSASSFSFPDYFIAKILCAKNRIKHNF